MVNPIEQLDALEKLSKTSVGIMMIFGYTELAIGFLVIYASTMDFVILDLSVKLIEYNEKAIRFNEKYKEPKMQTLTYDDLAKIVELHIDSCPTTLFKKS